MLGLYELSTIQAEREHKEQGHEAFGKSAAVEAGRRCGCADCYNCYALEVWEIEDEKLRARKKKNR